MIKKANFQKGEIMKTLKIKVPEELVELLGSEELVEKEATESLVIELVRTGKISHGKGAELLGMDLWEFKDLLNKYNLPYFDYEPKDFQKDLRTLRELEKKGSR